METNTMETNTMETNTMETNNIHSFIKRAFGNHNMTRVYLDYLMNPHDDLPPFTPVLYRAIACGGSNDIDTIMTNEKSHHKAKTRIVLSQLVEQYNNYVDLQDSN